MKFETFKAGRWQSRYQYKSFEPTLLNHDWQWQDSQINVLLESANRALGELNAFSLIVPDIDLFIQMHVVKEAQSSSRIFWFPRSSVGIHISLYSVHRTHSHAGA